MSLKSRTVIAATFHGVAIACTVLRLSYRYYVARLWWEDMWAALSLAFDSICFVCALLDRPTAVNYAMPAGSRRVFWLVSMAFPCVLWFARASILCSLMRVANPEGSLRHIVYGTGIFFVIMWIGTIAQKIYICERYACRIPNFVAISQLVTDMLSDGVLVVLPLLVFRHIHLPKNRKTLVLLSFSAAIFITAVTILHSAMLFGPDSTGIIVIGHVKVAVSLIVCDLLVLVTLVYRVCGFGDIDMPHSSETMVFTSVDLEQLGADCSICNSLSNPMRNSMSSAWRTTPNNVIKEDEDGNTPSAGKDIMAEKSTSTDAEVVVESIPSNSFYNTFP
ncbi:hypothetical protein DEU56DRAFT_899737 [Suillus clintonianus]|uniref:uncharacterized protein n=1 Tax=Suillus clintonianus TaxID=1904413 RepID=UPI001B8817DA|nr:uncharacterized protein DEU56DRAFT_899737 [Suillus clintonianus]KAG2146294.1 hypothetical protein DEU56DRAFT_899737 [Suillus clintonianus]